MRAFIGIKFKELNKSIMDLIFELKAADPLASYTREENIHLTLNFLGNIDEKQIGKVEEIFSKIDNKEFPITFNKLSNLRDMLILEVAINDELIKLQSFITRELLKFDFAVSNRKYFPHLTLCRKSNLRLKEEVNLKTNISEIVLFSSSRINNKLVYKPVLVKSLSNSF